MKLKETEKNKKNSNDMNDRKVNLRSNKNKEVNQSKIYKQKLKAVSLQKQ